MYTYVTVYKLCIQNTIITIITIITTTNLAVLIHDCMDRGFYTPFFATRVSIVSSCSGPKRVMNKHTLIPCNIALENNIISLSIHRLHLYILQWQHS